MTTVSTAALSPKSVRDLERRLRSAVAGGVRFDRLYRALYATDASIYQIVPVGVLLPRTGEDVAAAVRICAELGVPIVPRGAGTGLTGGAVGEGLQIDFSRSMNRIGRVDVERRCVEVEPGVVLDELNAQLRGTGLRFAPDVATSSRATIGGMIANNSCGAGSIRWGRTVDHVKSLRCVLADGQTVHFRSHGSGWGGDPSVERARIEQLQQCLGEIRDRYHSEIVARFPKVLRSNGGYGLDRLGPPGKVVDICKVLCGSEGTLALVVGAELNLVPIPQYKALIVLHFRDVLDAVSPTAAILRHGPAAVELIDKLILDAARANAALRARCDLLAGDPGALLVVELQDDDAEALSRRLAALQGDAEARGVAFAAVAVTEPDRQADVWRIRTSGLGLLMSKPGDEQPYSFVEDTAVDPARLRDYLSRFARLLDAEGVHAGYYAHASVGCIHVKPVLNLRRSEEVRTMQRIAEAVADLAVEFGGAFTGEHGDGIVRSDFLERVYGPRIVAAFAEVKGLFDPANVLNPHKIVDPWPMAERLRFGHAVASQSHKPTLDFSLPVSERAGVSLSGSEGMAALAGMCSGVGQCRQRSVGTMCPSYMATGDELHSTRGRANALRIALSDQGLLSGLDDPVLDEVMDLCLSCKACKTECPTGVDMARLKAEWRHRRNLVQGVSRRSRLVADMPGRLATWGRTPTLANWIGRSRAARAWMRVRYGLDARVPPPRFAGTSFRAWYRRRGGSLSRARGSLEEVEANGRRGARGDVIYFVDCWTNYFTPEVGVAAVTLLERAGFRVSCPELPCCGRPAISQGLLLDAREQATSVLRALADAEGVLRDEQTGSAPRIPVSPVWEDARVPILGSEPSCLFTFVDEIPALVRTAWARDVARRAMLVESFLARVMEQEPEALRFAPPSAPLLYHAHCHQKALIGTDDARRLLRSAYGDRAAEINSGCCGMAGSFGHECEHYEVARAVGEQRLFPAVRARGEAEIAISGFSCKQQIEHHTGVRTRHLLEHVVAVLSPWGDASP